MKFYDKNGDKHNTIVGAMLKNVSIKADKIVKGKMPGYEETINDNEHLYDVAEDRYDDQQEDITSTCEATALSEDSEVSTEAKESVIDVTVKTDEPKQEIKIDYAHQCINLVDGNGNILYSSKLDSRLLDGTVDKEMMDILYPMGKQIPEGFHTDIQSKFITGGRVSKSNDEPHPELNIDNTRDPDPDEPMG